jgi:hypothetical protein
MNSKHIKELQNSAILRERLAQVMAVRCIRNTKLEDFHSGQFPYSKAGDYSDVKVVFRSERYPGSLYQG